MSLENAQAANAWFLAVVALWRVALLVWFLHLLAGLKGFTIVVATLLPLALIVMALAMLNLEHVVFSLMSGIAPEQSSQNDLTYSVVTNLAVLSFLPSPELLVFYLGLIFKARKIIVRK